jgi:PKD repeat protein
MVGSSDSRGRESAARLGAVALAVLMVTSTFASGVGVAIAAGDGEDASVAGPTVDYDRSIEAGGGPSRAVDAAETETGTGEPADATGTATPTPASPPEPDGGTPTTPVPENDEPEADGPANVTPDAETVSTQASPPPADRRYLVKQGDDEYVVTAIGNGEGIVEFYDYYNAKAHTTTGIQEAETTLMFLWRGPNGLSLVVIHDKGDTTGAAVSMDFTGLPDEGSWVIQDDEGDFAGRSSVDWAWADSKTDGGAFRGGLDDGFEIGIDPRFNEEADRGPLDPGQIDRWSLLSDDVNAPTRYSLDFDQPVTIRPINGSTTAAFGYRPSQPEENESVLFDGTESFSSNGSLEYSWTFGDGTAATGEQVTHEYEQDGTYDVTLTVRNETGANDTVTRSVEVFDPSAVPPRVSDIETKTGGLVLEAFPYREPVTAEVTSADAIDRVVFTLGDTRKVDRDGSDGWQVKFDTAQLEAGSRELNVTAYDADGNADTETREYGVVPVHPVAEFVLQSGLAPPAQTTSRVEVSVTAPGDGGFPFDVPFPEESDGQSVPLIGGKGMATSTEFTFGTQYFPYKLVVDSFLRGEVGGELAGREVAGGGKGILRFDIEQAVRSTEVGRMVLDQFTIEFFALVDITPPQLNTFTRQYCLVGVCVEPPIDVDLMAPLDKAGLTFDVSGGGIDLVPKSGFVQLAIDGTGAADLTLKGVGIDAALNIKPAVKVNFEGGFSPSSVQPKIRVRLEISGQAWWVETTITPIDITSSWTLSDGLGSSREVAIEDRFGNQPVDDGVGTAGVGILSAETAEPAKKGRLTSDRVEDEAPAVAAQPGGYLVAWDRQDPDRPVTAGHDIVYTRVDGDATTRRKLTDDNKSDRHATVAGPAATNETMVAWTRLTESFVGNRTTDVNAFAEASEVAYAYRDAGGNWTSTRLLTDDDAYDYRPHLAHSGDLYLLAWSRDASGNLSTDGDESLEYAVLDGADATNRVSVAGARSPAVAGADGGPGFRLAYFQPSSVGSDDGSVVVEDGVATQDATATSYATTGFRDLAADNRSLVWTNGSIQDPTFQHVAADGTRREVAFGDGITGPQDLRLFAGPDYEVLVFRGEPDSRNESIDRKTLYYRVYRDGTWYDRRPLLSGSGDNRTYWQPSVAPRSDGFLGVAQGENFEREEYPDIFTVHHRYGIDLTVESSTNLTGRVPGETVAVNYTVRNRGDVPMEQNSSVDVRTAGGVPIASATAPALGVNESHEGTVQVTLPRTAALELAVEPESGADELDETNNTATLEFLPVNLRPVAVEETWSEDAVSVDVTVENTGSVAADDVPVALRENGTTLARTTVAGVGRDGGTNTAEFRFSRDGLDLNGSLAGLVVVDPAGDIAETDESDNVSAFRIGQPDLQVRPAGISARRTVCGVRATAVVGNSGPVDADATLRMSANGSVLAEQNVTVDGTGSSGGTSFERFATTFPAGNVPDPLTVTAVPDGFDADLMDNTANADVSVADSVSGTLSASVTRRPKRPQVGETMTLAASTTCDPSAVTSVEWDVDGDGTADRTGDAVNVSFDDPGTRSVTVGLTAINGRTANVTRELVVRPGDDRAVGQVGTLTVETAGRSDWQTVEFDGRYDDPVVVAGPPSQSDGSPAHVRVRNVTATGFELQLEEWAYQNGTHQSETVSFLVLEAGEYRLDDGLLAQVGTVSTGTEPTDVAFDRTFEATPVVATQVQTVADPTPVVTRQGNATADGFDVRLQTEEAIDDRSGAAETVGYVALTPVDGENYGSPIETGRASIGDFGETVSFRTEYLAPPNVLASVSTYEGTDTVQLRTTGRSETSVSFDLEEETSADAETDHTGETLDWIAVGRQNGTLFETDASLNPFPNGVPGTGIATPPSDVDGDGTYEDIDGDGAVEFEDVVSLAFALGQSESMSPAQRQALDFRDDGVLNFDDVIALAFTI